MKKITARKRHPISLRTLVQIGFFLLVLSFAVSHTLAEYGIEVPLLSEASLHAICPFGGVVSVYELATQGTFVQKIHESSLVLMGIVFLITLIFGPVFCGWLCPMGAVQEWVGKIGKKIWKKKYNNFVPRKLDGALRYLRYFVLLWVLYMTAVSGVLVFQDVDPYYSLFNFWTGEVAVSGFIVLGLTLLLALFVERPFCKYACPYGALLGLFNLIRIFPVRRNAKTCISCSACDRKCPMNIEVSKVGAVRHHQCISCLECTSEAACPVPKTVEIKVRKYS